jgi:hypothetical protein
VPAIAYQNPAFRLRLAAQNQARRLPPHGAARRQLCGFIRRNGYDFAGRFPQIVEAVSGLKVRPCFSDGEAIVVVPLAV